MGDRGIWFERILWSYMPCHWKGWALIALFALGLNAVMWIALAAAKALGHPDWEFVGFLVWPFGFMWLWRITERHCPPRS